MSRKFEQCNGFENVVLPKRATKGSAGYDFFCYEDTIIPPISESGKSTLVPTGVKAKMGTQEFLQLANRSSNPNKKHLIMSNGIGVIDSDYYGNPDNDGHIMFQFINYSSSPVTILKGEAIGQGIFLPFLTVDEEDDSFKERTGGFGSTDSK